MVTVVEVEVEVAVSEHNRRRLAPFLPRYPRLFVAASFVFMSTSWGNLRAQLRPAMLA